MPSKQAIAEFKALYHQHYGVVLTDEEAFKKASGLLRLYKTIYAPTMKMNTDETTTQSSNYPR